MTRTHQRAPLPASASTDATSAQDEVDGVALVRGASRGFSVLILGGLGAPLGSMVPVIGQYVLIIVAVVAFAIAGMNVGSATKAGVHGALAATLSYLLIMPLVISAQGGIEVIQTLGTLAVALAVGATSGVVARRTGFGTCR